nr:MAG TPA: hypothetical protein [Caudoviricetes sp.]
MGHTPCKAGFLFPFCWDILSIVLISEFVNT